MDVINSLVKNSNSTVITYHNINESTRLTTLELYRNYRFNRVTTTREGTVKDHGNNK